jgi:hypothetical protein
MDIRVIGQQQDEQVNGSPTLHEQSTAKMVDTDESVTSLALTTSMVNPIVEPLESFERFELLGKYDWLLATKQYRTEETSSVIGRPKVRPSCT